MFGGNFMFKKLFCLIAAFVFVLYVSGCGNDDEVTQPTQQTNVEQEDKKDQEPKQETKKESNTEKKQPVKQGETVTKWTEKQKMDSLIPLAKKYSWNEETVRNVVKIMDDCGIQFELLEPTKWENIRYIKAKNFQRPELELFIEDNKLKDIFVSLFGGRFYLYSINSDGEVFSRNEFSKVIKTNTLQKEVENKVKELLDAKGATLIPKTLSVELRAIPLEYISKFNIMDSKIICEVSFSYNVKSEVYGQDTERVDAKYIYENSELHEE